MLAKQKQHLVSFKVLKIIKNADCCNNLLSGKSDRKDEGESELSENMPCVSLCLL